MADTKTSATATIIQAAEHVVIDEATSIAKQVSAKNAAEIKGIVNGVAVEGVAATDDSASTIIENIEDGAKVIGSEIVKGAQAAVEAVEKHPELIAEGALAIGIGVASVVQPELIAGSVALVGKMAADSAKDTLNTIAVESGSGVVKGVAKGVTEKTAELAAQDAAEKAKKAALDSAKPGVEAEVDVKASGNVTAEVVDENGKKVLTTVAGDATATVRQVTPGPDPGPVLAEETVKTASTAVSEAKGDSNPVTMEGPSAVVTTDDLTGAKKAVVQQGSPTAIVASTEDAAAASKVSDAATVDVKALAKEVAKQMSELEDAKKNQAGEKTVTSITHTEDGSSTQLKDAASKLEADLNESKKAKTADSTQKPAEEEPKGNTKDVSEESQTAVSAPSGDNVVKEEAPTVNASNVEEVEKDKEVSESKPETAVQDTLSKDAGGPAEAEQKANDTRVEVPVLSQLGIVHTDPPVVKSKDAGDLEASKKLVDESSDSKVTADSTAPEVTIQEDKEEVKESQPKFGGMQAAKDMLKKAQQATEPYVPNLPTFKTKNISMEGPIANNMQSHGASAVKEAHHSPTHEAVLEAHKQIGLLHDSNVLLHKKIDTMQEALLAITKTLDKPAADDHEPAGLFGRLSWLFGCASPRKSRSSNVPPQITVTSAPNETTPLLAAS